MIAVIVGNRTTVMLLGGTQQAVRARSPWTWFCLMMQHSRRCLAVQCLQMRD